MRISVVRVVMCVAVLAALLASSAVATAALSDLSKVLDKCEAGSSHGMASRPSSVCVAVYGNVQAFTTTPGTLLRPSIRQRSATTTAGYLRDQGVLNPNFIWSDWFSNTTNLSSHVSGDWTVGPVWDGPIGQQSIDLHITGEPTDGRYVTCGRATYIVCEVARTEGKFFAGRWVFSAVRVSTRPLEVRIVNQSGHTLHRSSPSVLVTNLLRDDRIGDPKEIPSYSAANPDANVGWYNFYRHGVRAKRESSFETTYTLKSAAESNLNGATVRIVLALNADGSDNNSRCIADDRFATYLQCSVGVAGSASGTLIATVYVAQ